jgi:hypothetical protein
MAEFSGAGFWCSLMMTFDSREFGLSVRAIKNYGIIFGRVHRYFNFQILANNLLKNAQFLNRRCEAPCE